MKVTKQMLEIETRKKLLYLDQSILSLALKEGDSWVDDVMAQITELLDLQLLAIPYSFSHVAEADLYKQRDSLVSFIQRLSRGHDFYPYYKIERAQILKAFSSFLAGRPVADVRDESDAISGSVHDWDGDYMVAVFTRENGFDRKRPFKQLSVEALLGTLDQWSASNNTFEEDMELEFRDAARLYVEQYAKKAARLYTGDFAALIDSPIAAGIVGDLVFIARESKADPKSIDAFFASQHFRGLPSQQLAARLHSAFKERLRTKADVLPQSREKREEKYSGLMFDVEHASTYAPYCDGFFADRSMAALMKSKRVAIEKTYGCKVFSAASKDALFTWLSEIKASMTPEHEEALGWAYPKYITNISKAISQNAKSPKIIPRCL